MTPEKLSTELRAAALPPGELIYLERRGDEYTWVRGAMGTDAVLPDAWMCYTGAWPVDDKWDAFFTDLLAELNSMAGGDDSCRWSLDDPWPHGGLRT
ncbi:MAG: hypothetical protein ACRDZO_09755 [Egibacteraceae bacterium]